MASLFDIQILIEAFKTMYIVQVVSLGVVRLMSVMFTVFGLVAIAIEKDEATHSRYFKRGYGWGLSMIVVGIFLATVEWTVRAFTNAFGVNDDPLMLLSTDIESIGQLDEVDLFTVFIAGYLSLVAFFFIVGGFLAIIKASHRMEKGASVVLKYWVSGILLFWFSSYLRGT